MRAVAAGGGAGGEVGDCVGAEGERHAASAVAPDEVSTPPLAFGHWFGLGVAVNRESLGAACGAIAVTRLPAARVSIRER